MCQNNGKNHEMLAYILSGSVRILLYVFLLKNPESYAYEIAHHINVDISYVSRSLKELEAKNVVQCLNPESPRRKLYQLTLTALILKDDVLKRLNS